MLVPPHLLAGGPAWAVVTTASLSLVVWTGMVFSTRKFPALSRLDLALVGVWLWTLLQLVPLPPSVWMLVSPSRLQASTLALGGDGGWLAISLDPGRTAEQVVVGGAILGAYFSARVYTAEHGRRGVLLLALASSTLVAAAALGHELVGARAVYGVYDPIHAGPALLGPVLNPNHLGGFAAFGVPLGLSQAVRRSGRVRWVAMAATLICALVALLSGSRGGVASLVFGAILVGGFMAFRRRDRARRLRLLVVLFVVGGALALAAYIGLDSVFQDFERADYSKFDVALEGAGVAAAHPLVGIGRGAAAPVLAQFGDGRTWSMTPENILVCWAAEWGVLAALAVILSLGSAARDMFRSNRTDVWCSGAALVTVFVHDLADFLLEMPGLVVVVAALLGAATTRRSRRVGRVRYHRGGLSQPPWACWCSCSLRQGSVRSVSLPSWRGLGQTWRPWRRRWLGSIRWTRSWRCGLGMPT